MSFKPAKCPNCAGDLQVPEDRDTVKCMYCGSDIVVREAIKLAGGINIENLLMLAKSAEQAAMENIDYNRRSEAQKYYSAILEHDPKNIEAWLGKAFTSGNSSFYAIDIACLQTALELEHNSDVIKNIIINKYRELYAKLDKEFYQSATADRIVRQVNNYYDGRILYQLDPSDFRAFLSRASGSSDYKTKLDYYNKAILISDNKPEVISAIRQLLFKILFLNPYEHPYENGIRHELHPNYPVDIDSLISQNRPIDKIVKEILDEGRKRLHKSYNHNGKKCFIATAAYCSPMAAEVILLRQFRDNYLGNSWWGKVFVRTYYLVSPPIAQVIGKNQLLRILTRQFLKPIILLVKQHQRGKV